MPKSAYESRYLAVVAVGDAAWIEAAAEVTATVADVAAAEVETAEVPRRVENTAAGAGSGGTEGVAEADIEVVTIAGDVEVEGASVEAVEGAVAGQGHPTTTDQDSTTDLIAGDRHLPPTETTGGVRPGIGIILRHRVDTRQGVRPAVHPETCPRWVGGRHEDPHVKTAAVAHLVTFHRRRCVDLQGECLRVMGDLATFLLRHHSEAAVARETFPHVVPDPGICRLVPSSPVVVPGPCHPDPEAHPEIYHRGDEDHRREICHRVREDPLGTCRLGVRPVDLRETCRRVRAVPLVTFRHHPEGGDLPEICLQMGAGRLEVLPGICLRRGDEGRLEICRRGRVDHPEMTGARPRPEETMDAHRRLDTQEEGLQHVTRREDPRHRTGSGAGAPHHPDQQGQEIQGFLEHL